MNHSTSFGATARPPRAVLNAANVVTLLRLLLVPAAVGLILHGRHGMALLVFGLAGASDALDGWLARRHGGTVLGAWLDPAADKALLVGTFLALAWVGLLPPWLAGLVVARDALIVGGIGALAMLRRRVRIRPLFVGKLNTAVQISTVGVILSLEAFGLRAPGLRGVLVAATAGTTALSGAAYIRSALMGVR